jgi:hypothetical protein
MSRRLKKIIIYVAIVLALIFAENICINVFVAKTFTTDMYGFRDVIVQLFQIAKLLVNGFTVYVAYCLYNMFN